jgi:guanylate kinase
MWNRIVSKTKTPFLWVVSGPSGSGKTTLCNTLLLNKKLGVVRSVSLTTRSIRRGEQNRKDYVFISRQEFVNKIKTGDFLEWKRVFGNLYGTSKKLVYSLLKKNKDVLLCIDVKGALEIKKKFPKRCVSIFVIPPNAKELARRTRSRAREDRAEIQKRLAFANTELSFAKKYDYIIVNDNFSKALKELEAIITAKRLENDLHPSRKTN